MMNNLLLLMIIAITTSILTKTLQIKLTDHEKTEKLKQQMKKNPEKAKQYTIQALKPAIIKAIPTLIIIYILTQYYAGKTYYGIRWIWIYLLTMLIMNLMITIIHKHITRGEPLE